MRLDEKAFEIAHKEFRIEGGPDSRRLKAAIRAYLAAAPAPTVSNEWVMVPRTPTVAMLQAAGECFARMKETHQGGATGADYYRAMLAAAPAPTVSGEPVACPKCDGTGRMQTELRGFEHCTRCDGSGTLAALRKARTALDGLYEGFLHNTEAGREAWDNADGFEVCSEIDALLAAAAAPARGEVLEEPDMLEAGRKYEDNHKPDLIIRDEPFYSGAQLRAAYRHGYDFARAALPPTDKSPSE